MGLRVVSCSAAKEFRGELASLGSAAPMERLPFDGRPAPVSVVASAPPVARQMRTPWPFLPPHSANPLSSTYLPSSADGCQVPGAAELWHLPTADTVRRYPGYLPTT